MLIQIIFRKCQNMDKQNRWCWFLMISLCLCSCIISIISQMILNSMCSLCVFIRVKNEVRKVLCCGFVFLFNRWVNLYSFRFRKVMFNSLVIVSQLMVVLICLCCVFSMVKLQVIDDSSRNEVLIVISGRLNSLVLVGLFVQLCFSMLQVVNRQVKIRQLFIRQSQNFSNVLVFGWWFLVM